MARGDLIVQLIRAGNSGDRVQFVKIVEAIAADERAKKHNAMADRILAQIDYETGQKRTMLELAQRNGSNTLFYECLAKRKINDLILPPQVDTTIRNLVEEQKQAELLRSRGVEPRHSVLLAGPPGNGKTSLAESIAHALGLSFIVVRYESIIGSYLGETAQRLSQVFDYVRARHCVLFFDEFDAVGKERGDIQETGEIKRVVNSLLLQMDLLPSYVVVVVASNHHELLDRAVWRRFQVRLELPIPTRCQIIEWFKRFEINTDQNLGVDHCILADSLLGNSYSEIEEFGYDVLRQIILAGDYVDAPSITRNQLTMWQDRFGPGSNI